MERLPEIFAVGKELTFMNLLAVLLHPVAELVTVTIYVPWFEKVTFGIAGFWIEAVKPAGPLQEKVAFGAFVVTFSERVAPMQTEPLAGDEMIAEGRGLTITSILSVSPQPLPSVTEMI